MNAKQVAAKHAVSFIQEGMTVGLGTGSTALYAIEETGKLVKNGYQLQVVASSLRSEQLALEAGLTIIPFADIRNIDLYIDGADEVDANHNLIKGGGGALLREKILAYHSREFVVVVDDSKLVKTLGKFPVTVEVIPFAIELTLRSIKGLKCKPIIRQKEGRNFITDNGNYIVDCTFSSITDPAFLQHKLKQIPGVVESGLFQKELCGRVVVGYDDGHVEVLESF